eukprot:COSAG01_NODE_693_length_14202_cov_11.739491_8_plen_60_part_00
MTQVSSNRNGEHRTLLTFASTCSCAANKQVNESGDGNPGPARKGRKRSTRNSKIILYWH